MTFLGLFLNNELRTGGHRRYLELMEDLAARGNRVLVLLNEDLDYEPRSFEAVRVRARYKRGGAVPIALVYRSAAARAAGGLASRFGSAKPDWVLVHGETNFLAAELLAKRTEARLAFGHRSNAVREQLMKLAEMQGSGLAGFPARAAARYELQKYRRYEKMIARKADLVIFQSAYDRDDFSSRAPLPAARAAVVNGNIGLPRFPSELESANRSEALRKVAFVGTYGQRKGSRYLVEAIALLADRGLTHLRFEFAGPGDDRAERERYLAERGLSDMAVMRGRIEDPFAFMAAADLVIVPSLFDSFPDTVLEALHVGTPVIGSRVGGIPEMLARDELLFPPMDAPAIADRIERCAKDPDYYASLKALCEKRREAFHFDWAGAWQDAMAAAGKD